MIEIHLLADRPEMIPQVAAWLHEEWGHLWPGSSAASFAADLEHYRQRGALPLALVACVGSECAGTASLREHTPDFPASLTPWLVRVYVPAARRGQGIGAALVRAAEAQAAALGFPRLYLCTADRQALYARLGWLDQGERTYLGHEVTLMERILI